ncbi:MAG: hypothetical protein ABR589_09980 [Chthoniobacterales bacterium]
MKIRAVHENKKLKDAIADLLRKGMGTSEAREKMAKPVRLRGGPTTTEEIEAGINWGRE